MTKKEAKQEAKKLASDLIIGLLAAGWPFDGDTDQAKLTDEDQNKLSCALSELASKIRR